nr:ATP-binding protein [uncultured Desulfobacter sp.]
MNPNIKKFVFLGLVVMIAAIGILHHTTPGSLTLFHDTYRRLAYIPIAIGAIMYGLGGGMGLAILSCLAYIPHLFMYRFQGSVAYYSELSEIIFYLFAGLVIGLISSRENRLREKYRTISEQLQASYNRLHDQSIQLVQAEKELGKAKELSVLGQLSASLAHEIKNPLAAIKGAAEILADEVNEQHPKYEFVEIMRSEISRLNHSVEKVLNICRSQSTPSVDKDEPLETVINKVCQILNQGIEEKSIRLVVDEDPETGNAPVADQAMTQVLMNILINAMDAVAENGRIHISHKTAGDKGVCIEISDDGPGVSPAMAQEIFHPFKTFKQGGTGLGLSISKRIVERLGGTIDITASDMGGACFKICLLGKKQY